MGDEEQSKRLYNSAQNFLANGATALARKKLDEIVAKYPNTEHAAQARRQLEEMKLRQ